MGRLSPQGAMMMWDAPHVGVALPKGRPGRAIALNAADDPVEVQTYWTPDPRKGGGPDDDQDAALLARLRLANVTHEPVVVVPPTPRPLDDGEEVEPTYYDWIQAEFVPASQRPDLRLSVRPSRLPHMTLTKVLEVSDQPELAASPDEDGLEAGAEEGYGPLEQFRVEELLAGDLVLVDEDQALWAVVESSEEDLVEEGVYCVDWRTDDGEPGSLSLVAGEMVAARHPVEPGHGEALLSGPGEEDL